MAIPVWPNINYLAELDTWNLTTSDGKSRVGSSMDNGMTRYRRRFSSFMGAVDFSLHLDREEFERFNSFYTQTLNDGTLWFIMPIFDGSTYKPHLVRFGQDNNPKVTGDGYRSVSVTISLTIKAPFVIDDATFYLSDTYGGDLSLQMMIATDNFANTVYPNFATGAPRK